MDFQRLQFAAYLREEALKKIAETTRDMLPQEADAYREEHLIKVATEIFEEIDFIAGSAEANANDRSARSWTERLD